MPTSSVNSDFFQKMPQRPISRSLSLLQDHSMYHKKHVLQPCAEDAISRDSRTRSPFPAGFRAFPENFDFSFSSPLFYVRKNPASAEILTLKNPVCAGELQVPDRCADSAPCLLRLRISAHGTISSGGRTFRESDDFVSVPSMRSGKRIIQLPPSFHGAASNPLIQNAVLCCLKILFPGNIVGRRWKMYHAKKHPESRFSSVILPC